MGFFFLNEDIANKKDGFQRSSSTGTARETNSYNEKRITPGIYRENSRREKTELITPSVSSISHTDENDDDDDDDDDDDEDDSYCQSLCNCKFLLSTLRKSLQKRKLSNMGSKLRRAVSLGSENQLLMGMALSGYDRYAPGELSKMNIEERSE